MNPIVLLIITQLIAVIFRKYLEPALPTPETLKKGWNKHGQVILSFTISVLLVLVSICVICWQLLDDKIPFDRWYVANVAGYAAIAVYNMLSIGMLINRLQLIKIIIKIADTIEKSADVTGGIQQNLRGVYENVDILYEALKDFVGVYNRDFKHTKELEKIVQSLSDKHI
jgi:hypothetical protein